MHQFCEYLYTTAPSKVNNLVIEVLSNTSIYILWDPPTRPNGILIYYNITVFNEMSGFNFSTEIPAFEEHEVIVTGLRKKEKIKEYMLKLTLTNCREFRSLYGTSVCIYCSWKRQCSFDNDIYEPWR